MSGFTVMWTCYCSDAASSTSELSPACPHHGSPQMAAPWPNTLDGGVATGHRCWIDDPTTRPHPRATDHDREDDA